jgi:hypothetical protein
MPDTLCDACSEPIGAGPRCTHCGERIGQDDEESPGFGRDSIAVAALCALVAASLILLVLV